MTRLKYLSYTIVMQEVPNEVSLAINVSGCPHKCEGCHSKELWEYEGDFLLDDIKTLLDKYNGLISCVCFMGGDQNKDELIECLNIVKEHNLKTCLYTGSDTIDYSLVKRLDYVKIGRYIQELGGLDSETTNQRMYDLTKNREIFFNRKEYKYGN